MSSTLPILVVGAGFAGATVARELADHGIPVKLIERRHHIGGNAFDETDAHGLLVHRYGPHIFHTNAERIVHHLSRFTDWRPYEHRVLAEVDGQLLPIPINRTTINRLYGLDLDEAGVAAYLDSVRVPVEHPRTSEEVVLGSVGHDLCEKFFRGYTCKQWGLDLSELAAGVAARIPTRYDDDDRYFTDTHQAMPAAGYTEMFRRMLDHPLICVELGVDYLAGRSLNPARHVVTPARSTPSSTTATGRCPIAACASSTNTWPAPRNTSPSARSTTPTPATTLASLNSSISPASRQPAPPSCGNTPRRKATPTTRSPGPPTRPSTGATGRWLTPVTT